MCVHDIEEICKACNFRGLRMCYISYDVIMTKFIIFDTLITFIMTCKQKINILVIKMRLQVRVRDNDNIIRIQLE